MRVTSASSGEEIGGWLGFISFLRKHGLLIQGKTLSQGNGKRVVGEDPRNPFLTFTEVHMLGPAHPCVQTLTHTQIKI